MSKDWAARVVGYHQLDDYYAVRGMLAVVGRAGARPDAQTSGSGRRK